jgi:hypothetical protein
MGIEKAFTYWSCEKMLPVRAYGVSEKKIEK